MKNLITWNSFSPIFESLEEQVQLNESIIQELNKQNPIIEDVEDIMQEVGDSWGFTIQPGYTLRTGTNPNEQQFAELWTKASLDYFGMGEGDFDDPEEEFEWNLKFIDDIRRGIRKDILLDISFQYASEVNGFKPLKETEEQKQILSEAIERMESIGCKIEREDSPEGSALGTGLWKITVKVPVKFKPSKTLTSLDGLSKDVIKDFKTFTQKWSIDTNGQEELSDLIRRARN